MQQALSISAIIHCLLGRTSSDMDRRHVPRVPSSISDPSKNNVVIERRQKHRPKTAPSYHTSQVIQITPSKFNRLFSPLLQRRTYSVVQSFQKTRLQEPGSENHRLYGTGVRIFQVCHSNCSRIIVTQDEICQNVSRRFGFEQRQLVYQSFDRIFAPGPFKRTFLFLIFSRGSNTT